MCGDKRARGRAQTSGAVALPTSTLTGLLGDYGSLFSQCVARRRMRACASPHSRDALCRAVPCRAAHGRARRLSVAASGLDSLYALQLMTPETSFPYNLNNSLGIGGCDAGVCQPLNASVSAAMALGVRGRLPRLRLPARTSGGCCCCGGARLRSLRALMRRVVQSLSVAANASMSVHNLSVLLVRDARALQQLL